MDSPVYLDLNCGEREPLFFFLLNAYLHSRIETDNETTDDEEVNIYIAGLLHSIADGRFYADNAKCLASSPLDVCGMANEEDRPRCKAQIYRTNADHRFIGFGLFSSLGEHVSLYRRTMTPDESYLDQAQQFYVWAALFCARMPPRYRGLAMTLNKLAEGFDTYCQLNPAFDRASLVPEPSAEGGGATAN